jgi:hypothetical protein
MKSDLATEAGMFCKTIFLVSHDSVIFLRELLLVLLLLLSKTAEMVIMLSNACSQLKSSTGILVSCRDSSSRDGRAFWFLDIFAPFSSRSRNKYLQPRYI